MMRRELFNIRPRRGDMFLCKTRFDAFHETPLDDILKQRGINTLILTGAFFDQCVLETALGGKKRGYDVVVVPDLSIPAYKANAERHYTQAEVPLVKAAEILGQARNAAPPARIRRTPRLAG
jgi:nicotinamidase-related amidase